MGFTVAIAVLGGITIICYSIAIASIRDRHHTVFEFKAVIATKAIMFILGITELTIGIWATILGCMIGACNCCSVPLNQPTSGMCRTTRGVSAGYVSLAQGPDCCPVDMPVQEAGGVGTLPDGQPQGVPMFQVAGQPHASQVSMAEGFEKQLQMVPGHMQATQTVMTSAPEMQMDHGAEGGQVPPPCIGEDQILVAI
ncbi:PREDICTED: uncharacterized protein LOC107336925 isoform X2 [Acropora digitifera]|uniref:uncharacterized protein LOC107336925 isoform X2 n=1 Tax=Acropora digitifera TaxID=70779 RepID=UPI00077A55B9|nr:PREDICTED: uncharacterized protein LOC107336925 isoform X2 [Acropora digitifera]XP_015757507.1 PREDICTED: uncharacterized protein LOC107336925 isoform X2 [Acropora digitifera]